MTLALIGSNVGHGTSLVNDDVLRGKKKIDRVGRSSRHLVHQIAGTSWSRVRLSYTISRPRRKIRTLVVAGVPRAGRFPVESLVNSDQTWQQLTESTFERQKAFQRKCSPRTIELDQVGQTLGTGGQSPLNAPTRSSGIEAARGGLERGRSRASSMGAPRESSVHPTAGAESYDAAG
ncbi:hypothetical protein RP20_CCG001947 [Aedes albopictus]|nr:hypothetical protein RP20_CCG001947 [Aedes albopictus]